MKVLELFSGTGSIGKVFKERNHTVLSLDLKGADINCNILDWDYKKYKPNEFDYIHASPPCYTFSHCRKCYFGKPLKAHNPDWSIPDEQKIKFSEEIFQADQLTIGVPILNKTLEIIKYFNPTYYTIENPQTGDMKKYLTHLKHNDVTYCKYGFEYKKLTRIWNNLDKWKPKPVCSLKSLCDNIIVIDNHTHHKQACANKTKTQQRFKSKQLHDINRQISAGIDERYRIPPELIKEWEESMH